MTCDERVLKCSFRAATLRDREDSEDADDRGTTRRQPARRASISIGKGVGWVEEASETRKGHT